MDEYPRSAAAPGGITAGFLSSSQVFSKIDIDLMGRPSSGVAVDHFRDLVLIKISPRSW